MSISSWGSGGDSPQLRHLAPSTPKAIEDCRGILLWLIPLLDKFPRNRRFTLGERLESRLLTVLETLVSAAYSKQKAVLLQQANRDLEVCRHLWRLCYDLQLVSVKRYEYGSGLLLELGKQVGGWIRSGQQS